MRKPLKKLPLEQNTTASSVVFSGDLGFLPKKAPEMPVDALLAEKMAGQSNIAFITIGRNSGEGSADFKKKIRVITETIGDAFENFNFVIDPLEQAVVQGGATVVDHAVQARR
jgi:hypothetical protein